jgi:hypothetical protein
LVKFLVEKKQKRDWFYLRNPGLFFQIRVKPWVGNRVCVWVYGRDLIDELVRAGMDKNNLRARIRRRDRKIEDLKLEYFFKVSSLEGSIEFYKNRLRDQAKEIEEVMALTGKWLPSHQKWGRSEP